MLPLDITIPDNWLYAMILLIVAVIVFIIVILTGNLTKVKTERDNKVKELELTIRAVEMGYKAEATINAKDALDKWKKDELGSEVEKESRLLRQAALQMLEEWKVDETKKMKKEWVNKSMGVNYGKIAEHLLPFSEYLIDFNPKDMRFIGSPVDLMIFEGISAHHNDITIHFVEVKTGSGQLSKRQRRIKDAIDNNRIKWIPIFVEKVEWQIGDEQDEE